jgi:CRP-like cAMP-binding protein
MRPGIETLHALPLFESFSAALLAKVNEIADLARVGAAETLLRQGEPADVLNILISGHVTMARAEPGGGDALTGVISPIRPIGFAAALLGVASPITARTATAARLIVIPAPELRSMIAARPGLGLPFLDYALTELQELTIEVCELKVLSAAPRLAGYLLSLIEPPERNEARVALPYEKRLIAARIGCSQENLSRAFAALRRLGVETRRGVVVVRDIAALRVLSGSVAPRRQPGEAGRSDAIADRRSAGAA